MLAKLSFAFKNKRVNKQKALLAKQHRGALDSG